MRIFVWQANSSRDPQCYVSFFLNPDMSRRLPLLRVHDLLCMLIVAIDSVGESLPPPPPLDFFVYLNGNQKKKEIRSGASRGGKRNPRRLLEGVERCQKVSSHQRYSSSPPTYMFTCRRKEPTRVREIEVAVVFSFSSSFACFPFRFFFLLFPWERRKFFIVVW